MGQFFCLVDDPDSIAQKNYTLFLSSSQKKPCLDRHKIFACFKVFDSQNRLLLDLTNLFIIPQATEEKTRLFVKLSQSGF